jgi:MHS family proline/betaine transporter-like MFS transporter
MAETRAPTDLPRVESSVLRRAVLAGLIGHFVEWYDYGVYAYVAATLAVVFSHPTIQLFHYSLHLQHSP